MSTITLEINPRRGALLEGHDNECIALLRVQAPAAPDLRTPRKALNLALVIDRSGSMGGQPLEEAKRCAAMIVDRLGAEDRAAIVVYDNAVDLIVPAQPVSNRSVFHRALAQVQSGGSTALFDGWLAGAEQAALAADRDYLSRVLLLSDGCANHGLTDMRQIETHCREMAVCGVSTSTCGLGHNFNEDLMIAMAKAGQGQSYYGATAEDLLDPFTEEFDLLRAICARSLRLALTAPRGVTVRVLNDYQRDANGGWILPDLADGSEVWALASLTVPARLCTPGTTIEQLLQASVTFTVGARPARDETTIDVDSALSSSLSLPVLPAAAFAALAEDARVTARYQELRAAGLQLDARIAARASNWNRVDEILRQAELEAADNPWVAQSLQALRRHAQARHTEQFAKEAMYQSRSMNTRLASASECLDAYSPTGEQAVPSFLRRKQERGKRMDNADTGSK